MSEEKIAFLLHLQSHSTEQAARMAGLSAWSLYFHRSSDVEFRRKWEEVRSKKSPPWVAVFFAALTTSTAPEAAKTAGVTRQRVYQLYETNELFRSRWEAIRPIGARKSRR